VYSNGRDTPAPTHHPTPGTNAHDSTNGTPVAAALRMPGDPPVDTRPRVETRLRMAVLRLSCLQSMGVLRLLESDCVIRVMINKNADIATAAIIRAPTFVVMI